MKSKAGLKDQFMIALSFERNPDLTINNINRKIIEKCLQSAHLSIIKDYGQKPYKVDYTRGSAFKRYGLQANWKERDFFQEGSIRLGDIFKY